MPLLAALLLYLNGQSRWVGALRNRPATSVALAATLALFAFFGILKFLP
jgi:hypothetical protein